LSPGFGGTHETRFELVPQSVAVPSDVERDRVVEEAIEDAGGDQPIPEDVAQLAKPGCW